MEAPSRVRPPGDQSDGPRPVAVAPRGFGHRLGHRVRGALRRLRRVVPGGGESRGRVQVEGLAAGTGLLTGPTARSRQRAGVACPTCRAEAEVVIIDLHRHEVTWRCPVCDRSWVVADLPSGSRPSGSADAER